MYKWFDSNVQWMNIFTSIFSWFHIILNVNFVFKSSISFLKLSFQILFSLRKKWQFSKKMQKCSNNA